VKNNSVKIVCNKIVNDEKHGIRVCGCKEHTMSGSNGWTTIRRADNAHDIPSIKVLKQRFVCKECGGFNFRHLDGSLLRDEYSDDEIKQLQLLTRQKLTEKEN
jgi:hypothetical protein